jgi:hypothetical protein
MRHVCPLCTFFTRPQQLHQQQLEQLQSAQQSRHNDELAALQSQLDAANLSLSMLPPTTIIAATVDAASGTASATVATADAATTIDQALLIDVFTATDRVTDYFWSAKRAIVNSSDAVDHVMEAALLAKHAFHDDTAIDDPEAAPVCAECAKHEASLIDYRHELEAARARVMVLETTLAAAQTQVRQFWR